MEKIKKILLIIVQMSQFHIHKVNSKRVLIQFSICEDTGAPHRIDRVSISSYQIFRPSRVYMCIDIRFFQWDFFCEAVRVSGAYIISLYSEKISVAEHQGAVLLVIKTSMNRTTIFPSSKTINMAAMFQGIHCALFQQHMTKHIAV